MAIVIYDITYQACILEKDNAILPLSREHFNGYLLIHSMMSKPSRQIRHFNYKFRDTDCMQTQMCALPQPLPTYKSPMLTNCYVIIPASVIMFCKLLICFDKYLLKCSKRALSVDTENGEYAQNNCKKS